MNYLLDTNILVHAIKNTTTFSKINYDLDLFGISNSSFISAVSVGELYSFAQQRQWGNIKLAKIQELLTKITPIPVQDDHLMRTYAQIDTFSKGKHATLTLGRSAINMGKNDLWIAASAMITRATLVTTDNDYNHLHNIFINVKCYVV